ncbi:hypothetical protein [Actinophytocola sediminis]
MTIGVPAGQDVLLGDTKSQDLGEAEPVLRLPASGWPTMLTAVSMLRP